LNFEWDPNKARKNEIKHGVSFEEAKSVFDDEHARELIDEEHSEREERFTIIGMSIKYRVLFVCYCERNHEDTIRIISARKAEKIELDEYRRFLP
jgi:uncharacterized DUF497 family protein